MPEIGTSGSMSGDGKRSAAAWPKLPRPSSNYSSRTSGDVRLKSAKRTIADVKVGDHLSLEANRLDDC